MMYFFALNFSELMTFKILIQHLPPQKSIKNKLASILATWLTCFLLLFLGLSNSYAQSSQIQLPSLGETSSSVISLELEQQLGAAWLRSYYRQAPLNRDYLLQNYIETLVNQLKPYSQLDYTELNILVVDNPTMNAFAVPGGVIGIHSGLLLHAGTEDELASVIAHEFAHLTQRHFARSVAAQQSSGITTMAGLLAAVILAATAGSDAGLAALSISQGAALDA